MCNARPGERCAADTCMDKDVTEQAYVRAHPGAPEIDPLTPVEVAVANERLDDALDRLRDAHPGANTYEKIAVADARQDVRLAQLIGKHGAQTVNGPDGATLRLANGINAVVHVIDPEADFTEQDAADAPIGSLMLTGSHAAAYKVGPNQWDLQMNARTTPALHDNWRGTDDTFMRFSTDAGVARHHSIVRARPSQAA